MANRKNNTSFTLDKQIENLSLSSKVADILEERIVTGEIPQGTRLIEEDIASMLGVNRGSVREALTKLSENGLVVRVRNKYTEVKKYSKQDIEDIFYTRLAIEKMAAGLCIAKGKIIADDMEYYLQQMSSLEREKKLKWRDWVNYDLCFHESIVRASGNSLALKVWKSLECQTKALFYSTFHKFPRNISTKSHRNILDALISGNKMKIEEEIEKHIIKGYHDALDQITV